ncbi:hypothetical protein [Puia sp.]|uniref:hypothetical protein n=1 Tax=Puia sp. TaxID=2045100 RepID=UPI002D7FF669|nr:hypothetical protein [Puia sp.]
MMHPFYFRITVVCLAGSLLCSSCAVLTDSQVKNINVFATTTKAYCGFPSAVVKQYADLDQTLAIMKAADVRDFQHVQNQLNRARSGFQDKMSSAANFDLSLQMIQKYGALLAKLSCDDPANNLRDPSEDLGENLDNAVALFNQKTGSHLNASLGSDLSKLILLVGQRLTRRAQTVALKQFIEEVDPVIAAATANIEDVMNNGVKELWRQDSADFENFARVMLEHELAAGGAPGISLNRFEAARWYYDQLTVYRDADALRAQVVQAAVSLRNAHAALLADIHQKKQLKELVAETKQFITDVQPLGPLLSHYIKLP